MMKKERTRKSLLVRLCVLLGMASLIACSSTFSVDFSEVKCNLPQSLSDYFQSEQTLLGCLVLFWQGQPPDATYTSPIVLSKDGSFRLRGGRSDTDDRPSLPLPKESQSQPVQFRMYLFSPDEHKRLEQDFDDHKATCTSMSLGKKYNCFDAREERCWMAVQFQPKSSGSLKVFELKDSGGKNVSCRVCEPEKCDGVDNNCDGQVDEYDETRGQACAPAGETNTPTEQGGTPDAGGGE